MFKVGDKVVYKYKPKKIYTILHVNDLQTYIHIDDGMEWIHNIALFDSLSINRMMKIKKICSKLKTK